MNVMLAPSNFKSGGQSLSTYIINDCVAIDAGSLGLFGSPTEQARIRHVFLTHPHIDHVASLPIFLDNIYGLTGQRTVIHATESTLESLCDDIFNDRLMPKLFDWVGPHGPFIDAEPIAPGQTLRVEGLDITAIPVHHPVPTVGYIIDEGDITVAIVTDTGPTEEIWRELALRPHVAGVFIECSFPADLEWLAKLSGHLTTAMLRQELDKAPKSAEYYAIHVKPRYHEQVRAELKEFRKPRVRIAKAGKTYKFSPL